MNRANRGGRDVVSELMSEIRNAPRGGEVARPGGAAAVKRGGLGPRAYGVFVIVLTLAFGRGLLELAGHALAVDLHSHVVLIPFVSGWLLWSRRQSMPRDFTPCYNWASVFMVLSTLALLVFPGVVWGEGALSETDRLALLAGSYVGYVAAGGFLFMGRAWMAAAAFPICFLVFMIPLPDRAVMVLEGVLVEASAEAADILFRVAGIPALRDDQVFEIPGIVLEVARECSGIRSTWVLFITSLLGSQLFLESRWRRAVLVAAVLPLGIVRNGLRILVIGFLCVHEGPHMIESWIHRDGGPVFFGLSLGPLFLLLWWLRRGEAGRRGGRGGAPGCPVSSSRRG